MANMLFNCSVYSFVLHLRNDLYCIGWGIKLYSLTHLCSFVE